MLNARTAAGMRRGRRLLRCRMAWSYLAVASLLFSGCGALSHASPTTRLQDAVFDVNDAARWGRVDLAAQRVTIGYRSQFVSARRQWAKGIQVADMELLAVRFEPQEDFARAIVSFNWYLLAHMTLHHTILEQRWERGGGGFVLADERVVEGDGRLLAAPLLPTSPDEAPDDVRGATIER